MDYEDRVTEASVQIEKARALCRVFNELLYLDYSTLDEERLNEIKLDHATHGQLFSILTDILYNVSKLLEINSEDPKKTQY